MQCMMTWYFIRITYFIRRTHHASVIFWNFHLYVRSSGLWFSSSQSLNLPSEDKKKTVVLFPYLAHLPTNDNCPRVWTGKIYIDSFLVGSSRERSQTLEYLTFRTLLCINPTKEEHIDSPNHSFWRKIFIFNWPEFKSPYGYWICFIHQTQAVS